MITLERLVEYLQKERQADMQEQVEFIIITNAGRVVAAGIENQGRVLVKVLKYLEG